MKGERVDGGFFFESKGLYVHKMVDVKCRAVKEEEGKEEDWEVLFFFLSLGQRDGCLMKHLETF